MRAADVMTPDPVCISPDAPIIDAIRLMLQRLLHALASVAAETKPGPASDTSIRERLYAELKSQSWAPVGLINVVVRNGVVHLSGTLLDERHRGAIRVAAERIPGVKAIEDRLVWVEPISGMVMPAFEEVTTPQAKASSTLSQGPQVKGTA